MNSNHKFNLFALGRLVLGRANTLKKHTNWALSHRQKTSVYSKISACGTFFCLKNIDLSPNWGKPYKKNSLWRKSLLSFRSSQKTDKILIASENSAGHWKYLISLLIISFCVNWLKLWKKNKDSYFLKNFLKNISGRSVTVWILHAQCRTTKWNIKKVFKINAKWKKNLLVDLTNL